ncbi:MAG: Na/Pi symporter, partial [Rhodanobacter sp.]|nr:Na/Pi symporter [Rhodanobacter sp.]
MAGIGTGMLLGGLGLFLLGMLLMTEGLKQAAGPLLGRVLGASTQTRWRGLLSGMLVTALVQSSSAVTVAAIGFVNAGLLDLGQSLWVLFGANVGTTMTGWLVALIGFKIEVEAAALPVIGLGMALRLSGQHTRRAALGTALTGFGVLFLGIGFLQHAIVVDGHSLPWGLLGDGLLAVLAFVLGGLALTVLMQSSSAVLAVTLTLAQGGVLPLTEAAAMVIGSNIGTTVTALLAAIGATPNARRAASAHVAFNLLAAAVALALLPLLIHAVDGLRTLLGLDASPAVSLAMFHSVFNLLGVALMWPLANRLTAFLKRQFRTRDEDAAQARYLDRNVASVPSLAADALRRELQRLGDIALTVAWARLGHWLGDDQRPQEAAAYLPLSQVIHDFVTGVNRSSMSQSSAQALATLLRVQRYYDTCHELSGELVTTAALPTEPLQTATRALLRRGERLLLQLNPAHADFAPLDAEQANGFESDYQVLKAGLLAAGAAGQIDIARMDALLRSF